MRKYSILLLSLLLCACSDGTGRRDTRPYCDRPDGPYTGERALFAAYCDAMERCDIGATAGYAFQCRQECVQMFDFTTTCGMADDEYDLDRWSRKIEVREVIYDEEKGEECIEWWETADCELVSELLDTYQDSEGEELLPQACRGALQIQDEGGYPLPGTVEEGGECYSDSHCVEGLYCDRPESTDADYCEVCMALPSVGEPCRDHSCGTGAWCDYNQDPYMCVALIEDGQPCGDNHQCVSLRCYEGFCLDPYPDGQPCTDHRQCASGNCYEGSCFTRGEEGAACTDDAMCFTNRCYQDVCITIHQVGEPCEDHLQCRESCYQGFCIDDKENGEPCDEDVNCKYDSVCYEGICIHYSQHPTGAPCENDYDCASHLCLDLVCTDRVEPGDPCTRDEVCTESSGICHTDGLCGLPNGEVCWGNSMCRSGRCPGNTTCQDPLQDGEPCTANDQCLSYDCIVGFCHTPGDVGTPCTVHEHCDRRRFCDPITSTCQGQAYPGEPCVVDEGCRLEVCDEVAGLCGEPAGVACTSDNNCHGYCDATTSLCADLLPDGGDCDRDEMCINYCAYSSCVTLKPWGVECLTGEECEGGMCSKQYTRWRCHGPGECFAHEHCQEGDYCNEDDGSPYLCAPQKQDGELCDEDAECVHYCYSRYCREKKPDGADCETDEECQGGLCTDWGDCSRVGLCWSDEDCEEGQFCDRTLWDPMCSDPKPDGSACEGDEYCQSGWCAPMSDICGTQPGLGDPCSSWECPMYAYCLNGTCTTRKMPGAACDPSFYDDAECLAPSICRDGKCVTMPLDCYPGEAGEMCTFLMVCSEDSYCDLLDNFTCKKRSKAGQECTITMWRADTCVTTAYCDTTQEPYTCKAYAQLGEDCSTMECDPRTSYCEGTTCTEKKYSGELCTGDSQCIDGDCDNQGDDTRRCGGPCKMPD
jgi:hypothetical protein